jgi:hypothetical protein
VQDVNFLLRDFGVKVLDRENRRFGHPSSGRSGGCKR